MKTRLLKLLGIALTLAVVPSLFTYGMPVSANNFPSNFVIPLDMSSSVTDGSFAPTQYIGDPIDVTLPYGGNPLTKTIGFSVAYIPPGGNRTYTYQLDPSGTFGAGIAVLHYDSLTDDWINL